jgi:hypothetical protein
LISATILGKRIPGIDLMVVRRKEVHGAMQKDGKRERRWTCGTRHARREFHTRWCAARHASKESD